MDYKTLHLDWILSNPKFQPSGLCFDDYHLVMATLYMKPNVTQSVAKMFFDSDRHKLLNSRSQLEALAKEDLKYLKQNVTKLFITIGFNHQTWNASSCVKVIETIISFDWIKSCTAKFEYFRENGEHPHCHFLIELSYSISKSKVLEKIWATKGIKKVCLKKSFIDYKIAADYHGDYVNGIKAANKMQYVEKDIAWRKINNIPEVFEKI